MLKLAVVQFKPALGEKESNLNAVTFFLKNVRADIIVLPELSTTGYFFLDREETRLLGERFDGPSIKKLQKLVTSLGKILIFGFIETEKDRVYNSAALLFPDPSLSRVYRKTHLFYKEKFCFDLGDTGFFVVEDKSRDVKIGPMICYDWRFPEAARTLGLKGADLIVCPSNLVTDVWHLAMPARALENKTYLAIANRYGAETRLGEELVFKGLSAIYGYNGSIIEKAGPMGDQVLIADIDPAKTRDKSFNEYNDIIKDRRPELYF